MSQHPVDRLIRRLIQTDAVTPVEVEQVVDRLATAPFDQRLVPVAAVHRGVSYQGRHLRAREDAHFYHLVKRVVFDEQWADGTTAAELLTDLRHVIRASDSRVLVFQRRGGALAAVLGPNSLPPARRGPQAQPLLYVIYSADRGMIISGYQVSSAATISLPGETQWLK